MRKRTVVTVDNTELEMEEDRATLPEGTLISLCEGLLYDRIREKIKSVVVDVPPVAYSDTLIARVAAALVVGGTLYVPTEYTDTYIRWANIYLQIDHERSNEQYVVFVKR